MNKAAYGGRGEGDEGGSYRIRVLEGEINKAKESERKMLESFASQTKQLEQAKMELEEARLEIRNLQNSIRGSESARAPSARNLFRSLLEKPQPPPSAPARPEVVEEEVSRLKGELRLAMEAEEKDKRAMDGLALALKEVTEEANRAMDKLATAQSELRAASAEADRLKSALEAREDDLRAVSAEVERLRLEAEESAAAWSAKEEGLIGCVKSSVEEAARAMRENRRLLDTREEAREENARLRDIMKQALSEADAARAGLEVARRESSQLKRQLSEKAKSLKTIRQECECLKAAGEEAAAAAAAAALQSARQHKCLTTSGRSRSARSSGSGSSGKPEDMFQSERWSNATGPRIQNAAKAPEAGAGSFRETGSAGEASPWGKNGTHGTGGCVSSMKLLEAAIKPVYVFDGQPPDLKKQELAKRFSKRADATEDVTTALEDDDKEGIGKYSKSTVKVTRQHNEGSKLLLRLMGVPVVEAPSDAEAECAALFKNGKAFDVASEDMDSLTFGSPRFL